MQVKILGSAAGGAFPQWNCGCANCLAVRAGNFTGKARSQTQVAISADSRTWFLLGASPDLRTQIERTIELHPGEGLRQSPIAGAVLLNADVDHVLGLLLLRELQPLNVYATESVKQIVDQDNSMFRMLRRVPKQLTWNPITPRVTFPLHDIEEKDSGIRCCAVSLATHFPAYVAQTRQEALNGAEASLGLIVESPSRKRMAYMPAVPEITGELIKEFESCDVVLFDGTFWSEDELIRVQGSGQTARQMGHVPISSEAGSLAQLAALKRPRKIYIHVNNTNPVLNEAGAEHRGVRDAGWEIAEDGWQFEL